MKHIFSKKNRALLSELVRTDFKLRYQGSVLGYAWSLLKPLLMFGILYVVFVEFLSIGGDIPNYPIYLLFGIVLWNFFSEITNLGLLSIVGRGELIRKISIPRWIIVLSSSITGMINLGLNMLVVLVFLFFSKADLLSTSALVPIFILEIYVFALGISLLLSAAYVKYRDISYIWEVLMQAGFYLTPILYPISMIPEQFQKFILLSPVAQAMQDARYSLVTHKAVTLHSLTNSYIYYLIPLGIVMLVLVIGIVYFRSQSKHFAENL